MKGFARRLTRVRWIHPREAFATRAEYRRNKRYHLRSGNSACRRLDTENGGAFDPPYVARPGQRTR
jgi:hypothetical protein